MIVVHKVDEVYLCVDGPLSVRRALADHFSFMVPGARYMPSYRSGAWDGRVRLYDMKSGYLYLGLLPRLSAFLKSRNWPAEWVGLDDEPDDQSDAALSRFVKGLKLPFELYDYQMETFSYAVRHRRAVFLSATGSGKSMSVYLICRWIEKHFNHRTLLIVPTVSLVKQMSADFDSYGGKGLYQQIYSGQSKEIEAPIVISTWQSLTGLSREFFDRFRCVIVDETHTAKAKKLTNILEMLVKSAYRFGFTGTLDEVATHQAIIEGLLGPVRTMARSSELIERKILAELKVNVLKLKYPETTCMNVLGGSYQDEIATINSSHRRNNLIVRLCEKTRGNTLVLFNYIEKHGDILIERLRSETSKEIHYVHGKVDADVRETIRKIVDTSDRAVVLASVGTFSTGINIKRLHNVIFASPSKSRIRVLQSIGRGLRVAADKSKCTLFDLVDDFRLGEDVNYTYRHYEGRRKMYEDEGFPYVERSIELAAQES